MYQRERLHPVDGIDGVHVQCVCMICGSGIRPCHGCARFVDGAGLVAVWTFAGTVFVTGQERQGARVWHVLSCGTRECMQVIKAAFDQIWNLIFSRPERRSSRAEYRRRPAPAPPARKETATALIPRS